MPDSAVIQLLSLVWKHNREADGHSWLKVNHSMHDALFLALRSGMKFARDDFRTIANNFRLGYWGGDLEYFYRDAVLYRNPPAWQAYEEYRSRKPFIVQGARLHHHTGDGPCGEGLSRLVVGAEFKWNSETVAVSSFNDAKGYFVACSHTRDAAETCPNCGSYKTWPQPKLLHRYKITHEDLRKARAAQKAQEAPNAQ